MARCLVVNSEWRVIGTNSKPFWKHIPNFYTSNKYVPKINFDRILEHVLEFRERHHVHVRNTLVLLQPSNSNQ